MNKKLSIVIPCYNSEKMIEKVIDETVRQLDELNINKYEFVLVNDKSSDNTFEIIAKLANQRHYIKAIDLAKNSGQHNALITGLRFGDGDIFVGMDDDMQTHPSQLKFLLDKLEEGYDIVYGTYPNKKSNWFRKIGSNFNSFTYSKLIDKPMEMKISSYWVAKKFIIDEVVKYPSSYINLQGIFLRTTSNYTNVKIEHFDRMSGKSGYSLKRLIRLWSAALNYSILPLRFSFNIAILLSIVVLVQLVFGLFKGQIPFMLIWFEIIMVMLFFVIGILGEYIGRILMINTNDPQSVVRQYIYKGKK